MPDSDERIVDGQMDWSGGVDSSRVTTIASEVNPNGLKRNMLAWLNNGSVRGGGINQRLGWQPITTIVDSGLYQAGFMYIQEDQLPYLILRISGRHYRIRLDTDNSVDDISGGFVDSATEPYGYMEQGAEFLVSQVGDYVTLPLFWDGSTMRRSNGLSGSPRELPAAGPMDYYMNRLWYAIGRVYTAGDIEGGPSGTNAGRTNAILRVTENPLAIGGDGFRVPTTAGIIRALKHTANLDTALGQGPLFPFTRKSVYALTVPVTRNDWIAADNNNQPLQRVAQINFGSYNDRSVVNENGDLFYQSSDGIRSLFQSIRYFQQWGNTAISENVRRALEFNDRSLMRFSSGVSFDNRMWQTALPIRTNAGTGFRAVLPLDFDLISTLQEKLPPAWEGAYESPDIHILEMFTGDFGGRQRAFAVGVNKEDGHTIELWEFTTSERFENGDHRVPWGFETPAFVWNRPFALKELDSGELHVDKLFGTVDFKVEYRVDDYPCWFFWHMWRECAARDCAEELEDVICPDYPREPFCEQFRSPMTLPKPIPNCVGIDGSNRPIVIKKKGRPSNLGFQFQVRVTITGWTRVRKILLFAIPKDRSPYYGLVC